MQPDNDFKDCLEILADFKKHLPTFKEIHSLTTQLEQTKKKIYKITGGHRVLYEIGETIKQIQALESISQVDIRKLEEKITFWSNKLRN